MQLFNTADWSFIFVNHRTSHIAHRTSHIAHAHRTRTRTSHTAHLEAIAYARLALRRKRFPIGVKKKSKNDRNYKFPDSISTNFFFKSKAIVSGTRLDHLLHEDRMVIPGSKTGAYGKGYPRGKKTTAGRPPCGRATPQMAVRPFGWWPARRT
jgi:hypothetical protein